MSRDDFTTATKRALAQRSGGRCSFPGCDKLCWLPGEGPSKAASIGVAAHICAASSDGPRFDVSQTPEERKNISNAIYMCQNHAREIDTDEIRFTVKVLKDWKERHESQIRGQADGKWLLPKIEIKRGIGVTINAMEESIITEDKIGHRIEHVVLITNSSDFEARRIGFTIQYPELIEHPPKISGPPGFNYTLSCENMDSEVSVKGGGMIKIPKVTHYGSFTLEGTSLLQGQSISLVISSIPDVYPLPLRENKSLFWICGELGVSVGTMLEKQSFVAPFIYDRENRSVAAGYVHAVNPEADEYITLRRS